MTRHEATADHKFVFQKRYILGYKPISNYQHSLIFFSVDQLQCYLNINHKLVCFFFYEEYKAMLIAIYWLASKDIPLSQYESHIDFLKQIGVALSCLKLNDRVQYKSYFPTNEILNAINEYVD